jgi:hypothetical protein
MIFFYASFFDYNLLIIMGIGWCGIYLHSSPIATATWNKFARVSRALPRPLLLSTMAKCWDECACHALNEAVHYQGGGNFSTSIGIWENCVPAL